MAGNAAGQDLISQQIHANNLANSKTHGFKADKQANFSIPIDGSGYSSRVYSQSTENIVDLSQGNLARTNNPLDLALVNEGFFALQDLQGNLVLSRDGQFQLDANGQLINQEGLGVLGANGPIFLQPGDMSVGKNGLIQVQTPDGAIETTQILLTRPESVTKRADGYFQSGAEGELVFDPNVRLEQGALEESNVNPMFEMVSIIDTARHYELQMKYMQNMEDNDSKLSQIMQL